MMRMDMVRSVRIMLEVIDGQYDHTACLLGIEIREGGGYVEHEARKYCHHDRLGPLTLLNDQLDGTPSTSTVHIRVCQR